MTSPKVFSKSERISSKPEAGHKLLKSVCFLAIPVLFTLTWVEAGTSFWSRVSLVIINALLVFSLGEVFDLLPLNHIRLYHSAYFLSLFIAVMRWALKAYPFVHSLDLLSVGLAALGAFLGGLLVTTLRWGLVEDYPPLQKVEAEVRDRHSTLLNSISPTPFYKRAFDISLASFGLLISSPVWLLITWLIWLEDPGPLFFIKNSVGRAGKTIRLFKFRSMARESGKAVGPLYVSREDNRVLRSGLILRKTAMDELPQLLNILLGDLSFVGPRPHRTEVVLEYLEILPEFAERHQVIPGLAGLAQVVGSNSSSPRQKLRLDRLYIRHASFGFDIKLLILAFLVVFYLRWKKDWNERIPRGWMRFRL
jgi:lipopolysaccharide/colanic/teichoic acid biosynthesis glycosyltransferase